MPAPGLATEINQACSGKKWPGEGNAEREGTPAKDLACGLSEIKQLGAGMGKSVLRPLSSGGSTRPRQACSEHILSLISLCGYDSLMRTDCSWAATREETHEHTG